MRPDGDSPQAELVRRKGEEQERAHLAALDAGGKRIVRIERGDDWEAAALATAEAMRAGAEVVYQAVLLDPGGWRGVADFVERQADGSYEVADTKLARTSKPTHLLQLSFYSEQVARIQGRLPDRMHIVLGSGERVSYRVRDFDGYYRRVRRRFLDWVADPPTTYPYPVAHCAVCEWLVRCKRQWIADDHLTLVAQMRRRWVDALGEVAIGTLEQLATAQAKLESSLQSHIFERLRRQAELQHRARISTTPRP